MILFLSLVRVVERLLMKDHPLWRNAPLYLVLMIDSMGLGLLFPVLNSLIMDPHQHFLATAMSQSTRELLFSATIAIFMICWFFGAAILGDLSDFIGRKKSLLICLMGAFGGYLLSGIAVEVGSFTLLILGRVIAGFTAGSQAIAQAAIIDVSTPEQKAQNLAYMILAMSLGFVFGPILGGALSSPHLVSWFRLSTPLYFSAIISFINAILILLFFTETFSVKRKIVFRLGKAIDMFFSAFRHSKIRVLSIAFLIMIFAWGSYFSFISMFALERYHYSTEWVSMLLMALAVGFSIGSAYLVEFLTKRFSLQKTVIYTLLIGSVMALITLIHHSSFMWVAAVIIGAAISTAYSVMLTLFSNQVDEKEQGWIMGVSGSIMSLSFGATTFITGLIVRLSINYSMLMCAIGFISTAVI